MRDTKRYLRLDELGVWRVGDTRVPLDSVAAGLHQGQSPETIRQSYPALSLEAVYGAIADYLANQAELDAYLRRQDDVWDRARARAEANPSAVVERLAQGDAQGYIFGAVSRPRFLADHDLKEPIVDGVVRREPTVEFRLLGDVGLAASPDADVLAYAADHGLLVLTHDVNTMPARAYDRIAAGRPVAGLLMVRQTEMVSAVIESLVLIWSSSELEEWAGQVAFLPL